MYQKLLHTKGLRLLGGLLGSLLLAAAINVFIVPQGLYGGGAYGLCQVIRTLVLRALDLELPFDLAGVLYFCVNIPLFMLAFRALGREFFLKVAICTAAIATLVYIDPRQRAHALVGLQHHRTHPDAETHHDHDGRRTDGDAEDRQYGPHLPSLQVTRCELDKIK